MFFHPTDEACYWPIFHQMFYLTLGSRLKLNFALNVNKLGTGILKNICSVALTRWHWQSCPYKIKQLNGIYVFL